MAQPAVVIPEKIYFKIGEVCELVGVQAHVLRYWETEFPMLSPQKNRSGQRSYRRRDVEISLRIKELLYDELFTIAGAKKKLQTELRDSSRLKVVYSEAKEESEQLRAVDPPSLFEDERDYGEPQPSQRPILNADILSNDGREALRSLGSQLLELREMLRSGAKK